MRPPRPDPPPGAAERAGALTLLPLRRPAAGAIFLLASASIATLLIYFFGWISMGAAVRWILLPAAALLLLLLLRLHRGGDRELPERAAAGLWAGTLATFAYDLVRVPIAASGAPVFKAISYFGTLILDQGAPTLASEVAGWGYHLSNGAGFGLMYAVLLARPSPWTAMLWGVTLEAAMLVTPYAEVFGYRLSPTFFAVTIGSHLIYGAVLWAGLAWWRRLRPAVSGGRGRRAPLAAVALASLVGIGAVAADFHGRHAATIPASPPSYLGEHLYTTWNALEPDRVAVVWLMRRFVDPEARFHFVEPFTRIRFGRPLDTTDAEVRRSGSRSASERLIAERGLEADPKLRELAEMTHLFEIARWRLPSRPRAYELGAELMAAVGDCPAGDVAPCVERGMRFLDRWYAAPTS